MSAALGALEADRGHPFVYQPSILPSVQVTRVIDPARKGVIVNRTAATFQPSKQAGPDIGRQFELHRATGLLLNNDRTSSNLCTRDQVTNLDFDQITVAQLTVDREVEQSAIAKPPFRAQGRNEQSIFASASEAV